jgi:hypothetical protein
MDFLLAGTLSSFIDGVSMPGDCPASLHLLLLVCGKHSAPSRTLFRQATKTVRVVETKTAKLICEIKAVKDINTAEVQDKAKAAVKWCEHATTHEKQIGGKPWSYVLIPHDTVTEAKTIQGLAAAYTQKRSATAVGVRTSCSVCDFLR